MNEFKALPKMLFSRAQLLRPSVRGVTTVKAWFRYASGNSNGLEVSENRLWLVNHIAGGDGKILLSAAHSRK